MNTKIQLDLNRLEQENQVRVLYAAASASSERATPWKNPGPIQFIYIRSTAASHAEGLLEITHDDVPFVGWELRQVLDRIATGDRQMKIWAKPAVLYYADPGFALIFGWLLHELGRSPEISEPWEHLLIDELCLDQAA